MVQERWKHVRELKVKNWTHIFVSRWNHTKLVSNERGDQKGSISALVGGKHEQKWQFNAYVGSEEITRYNP